MNTQLPIYAKKDEIVRAVRDNETVIITSETGSGKSTQVPQYLFEAGFTVVCTEPRRIACVNLANRVREEIEAEGGDFRHVGYQTALETDKFRETRILYCTDGLKLAQGIRDDETILIIDEVHEWNLNIEMLVAWVKKHREARGRIRIVVMSATVDAGALEKFCGKAAHIHIEGRMYRVRKHFAPDMPDIAFSDGSFDAGNEIFSVFGEVFDATVKKLVGEKRNILIFRPGRREIMETIGRLRRLLGDTKAVLLPMYGDLPLAEQKKCFCSYDVPKIVVATNITQTSVTIPDIDAVIDDGKRKLVKAIDGIETLMVADISQADIEQRAGRAGRVREGEYYLFAETGYRPKWSEPDIRRLLLDQVVLRFAALGFDAETMEFFHQPEPASIFAAKKTLRLLSAIDDDGITELGRRLASYPVSARSAMIIERARKEGIVNEMLKAVAILEGGNLGMARESAEKRSDILRQMELFDEVRDLPELPAFVNEKAFTRVKDYMTRLSEFIIPGEKCDRTSETFYHKFLRSLYAGHPDHVFHEAFREDYGENRKPHSFFGVDGRRYSFTHATCCGLSRWVLAFPRRSLDGVSFQEVIENISVIPKELLHDILDPAHIETQDFVLWQGETSIILRRRAYMGVHRFKSEILNGEAKNLSQGRIEETEKLCIRIQDEEFPVSYKPMKDGGRFGVDFTNYGDIRDIPPMKAPDGKPFVFFCNGARAESVAELRKKVEELFAESEKKDPRSFAGIPIVSVHDYYRYVHSRTGRCRLRNRNGKSETVFFGLFHDNLGFRTFVEEASFTSEEKNRCAILAFARSYAQARGVHVPKNTEKTPAWLFEFVKCFLIRSRDWTEYFLRVMKRIYIRNGYISRNDVWKYKRYTTMALSHEASRLLDEHNKLHARGGNHGKDRH